MSMLRGLIVLTLCVGTIKIAAFGSSYRGESAAVVFFAPGQIALQQFL
jgi:hypothetical protein